LNLSPYSFLTAGCADGILLYSCGNKEVVQYDPDNPDEGECKYIDRNKKYTK
jgi:hypothetical protein